MPGKKLLLTSARCQFTLFTLWFSFICFSQVFFFMPSVFAGQATVLTDDELDNIYVGGFEFNLNAAYAFRSAVVSQINVAAVRSMNAKGAIRISATNQALVKNQGDSAIANQLNLNAVVAQSGDLLNTVINNLNVAKVSNLFTPEETAVVDSLISDAPLDIDIPSSSTPTVGVEADASFGSAPVEQTAVSLAPASTVSTPSPVSVNVPASSTAAVTVPSQAAALPVSVPVEKTAVSLAPASTVSTPSPVSVNVPVASTAAVTVPSPTAALPVSVPVEQKATSLAPVSTASAAQPVSLNEPVVSTPAAAVSTLIQTTTDPSASAPVDNASLGTTATGGSLNKVKATASAVSAQTNIAALFAPRGRIAKARINNANMSSVENQGNAALSAQTNIAVLIAQKDIKDTIVNNLNIAEATNVNTTTAGGAEVRSFSLAGVLMNVSISNVVAQNEAKVAQANITFMKSLRGKIKNSVVKGLNSSKAVTIW
jgi:hypothetical protein